MEKRERMSDVRVCSLGITICGDCCVGVCVGLGCQCILGTSGSERGESGCGKDAVVAERRCDHVREGQK